MATFPTCYGSCAGPLGFPMTDRAALAVDALLKTLPAGPEFQYRHAVVTRAPTEVNPGERSDVSWISTESPDRMNEVIVARGMNDAQFQRNPLVTLGHAYWLPPVGKSLWRKRARDGSLVGIKAKTIYPVRPSTWAAGDPWPPDKVLALIQAGLLQGKSIGFLPLKVHTPDDRERERSGWANVTLVIDEWLLLEYACVFLPANQDALVESVSKGSVELPEPFLKALGMDPALCTRATLPAPTLTTFTPLAEIEKAVQARLAAIDFTRLAEQAVASALDRRRGRV